MARHLRGYDYEPEYTTEELDELSRAAVTTSALHLKTCIKIRKRHGFAQQKMVDVIFIIKHRFYLKSFITFINATKVY